ncbi:hypothetical protein QE197_22815 (plasmid) [Arsenophonus nasoniae]|uniref:Uncharacterized protein n=2 Tax=Arsenophonus nasoniae TaxID=638 RepID=A0A4P7LBC9_9GAMM|nr:hypothetical protein [Arsenophonus nasoniae]QBY46422.1 hypothetical protein ArsFIN_50330 [Arsenophonus nasoniae]QBY46511.1 hypothetical protein ArsFIN_51220 [Arsenophonus nasoniae]WGM03708.1 hypothetical protein QE210_20015 [Arsenophonus nasoniae]WGM08567.1 hypothetical protein QE258_24915 [Arsenophonus nasoniae]WGM13388.1 hypothetical protein QE197_22815 [Arsenophonus nasoniae]
MNLYIAEKTSRAKDIATEMNGKFNKSDKERFNTRIGREVILWDYLKTDKVIADIGIDITIKDPDLYDRISNYVLLHGEDLQGMFKNEKYLYMSCFIRDVRAFRNEFELEERLKPLFSHGKGDAFEFVISFPEKMNFDEKDIIKSSFVNISQQHVLTINDVIWECFVHQTKNGQIVDAQFEACRSNIDKYSRAELVNINLIDTFQPNSYVRQLLRGAEKIGNIDGRSVWFNPHGYYFCWDKETEYLLESWLTFPAYPIHW